MALPRILVIDDELGKPGDNKRRRDFCTLAGAEDVTADADVKVIIDPITEAVFCSGQSGVGGQPKNDLEHVARTVASGWPGPDGRRWSLILIDRRFPDSQGGGESFGYQVLERLVERWPDPDARSGNCEIPVVMLSVHPPSGDRASKAGANAYVEQPDLSRSKMQELLDHFGLMEDSQQELIGRSVSVLKTLRLARQAGRGGIGNTLLLGETGSGKTHLAQYIHRHSLRCGTALQIALGHSGHDPALLRDELFGHWVGAFNGAETSEPGKAERADGGALLIDELACLDPAGQALLLDYAQYTLREQDAAVRYVRQVTRMGHFPTQRAARAQAMQSLQTRRVDQQTNRVEVDVFLISATNAPLDQPGILEEIGFRPDLFARLSRDLVIRLPPLRDRKEDIPALFLRRLEESTRARGGVLPKTLDAAVVDALLAHDWPLNIRELENVASSAAATSLAWEEVLVRHLPPLAASTRTAISTTAPKKVAPDPLSRLAATTSTVRPFDTNPKLASRDDVSGILERATADAEEALARLLVPALKAALELTRKVPEGTLQLTPAVNLLRGSRGSTTTAKRDLLKVFELVKTRAPDLLHSSQALTELWSLLPAPADSDATSASPRARSRPERPEEA